MNLSRNIARQKQSKFTHRDRTVMRWLLMAMTEDADTLRDFILELTMLSQAKDRADLAEALDGGQSEDYRRLLLNLVQQVSGEVEEWLEEEANPSDRQLLNVAPQ